MSQETQEVDEVSNCCRLTIVDNYYLQMWFSPAERDPRRVRLASSPLLGGPLRGRGPGWRDRGDAAPSSRVPAPSRTLLERKAEGRPARPGHRQFTARGLRLPAAVTITICKALPADARRAEPTASDSKFQGPGPTVSEDTGLPGAGPRGPLRFS